MRSLALLLLLVHGATAFAAQPVALVGATVIDPASGTVTHGATVVIVGDRITAVGADVVAPADATRIDGVGRWLVPGYVDAHVHFFQSGGLYTRPDAIDLRRLVPYDVEVARIRDQIDETLRRYLRCGITAVADVGGPTWNLAVRDRAQRSDLAPRVAATGPLLSPMAPPQLQHADPPIVQVDSADGAVAQVRAQAALRPDFIKIWWIRDDPAFRPIAAAIIAESHRLGLRVAIHATELAIAHQAVEAGADVLVHSVDDVALDDAFVLRLVERRIPYCSTAVVHEGYDAVFDGSFSPTMEELAWADPFALGTLFDLAHVPEEALPPWLAKARRDHRRLTRGRDAVAARNCAVLDRAGGVVAVGTDAGNIGTLPGPALFREFAALRAAGMEPMAILRCATLGGARLMGRESDFGAIRVGLLADVVLLDADPLVDIGNAASIHTIVRGGVVIDPATLLASDPATVAQRGLDAVNAVSPGAFRALFADDASIADDVGNLAPRSDAFVLRFRRFAHGHRELLARDVADDRVTDTTQQLQPVPLRPRIETWRWRVVGGRVVDLAIVDAARADR